MRVNGLGEWACRNEVSFPFGWYLSGSRMPSRDVFRVVAECRGLGRVNRPYSLDVGMFEAIVELNFTSSGALQTDREKGVNISTRIRFVPGFGMALIFFHDEQLSTKRFIFAFLLAIAFFQAKKPILVKKTNV